MPQYEFEEVGTGRRFDVWFPGSEAPDFGVEMDVGGVRAVRIVSRPQVVKPKEYAHVAHGLPPNDPAAPRWDAEGQPVFHTKREIEDYQAKRPGMRWD